MAAVDAVSTGRRLIAGVAAAVAAVLTLQESAGGGIPGSKEALIAAAGSSMKAMLRTFAGRAQVDAAKGIAPWNGATPFC